MAGIEPAYDSLDANGPPGVRAVTVYVSLVREVLVLYRKREGARRLHEHGVFARFRYNDLKEAARDCGGRGPYAS